MKSKIIKTDRYKVRPGTKIRLQDWDPDDSSGFAEGKKEGEERFAALKSRLDELQNLLYAGHEHRVLIVLQALDTAGKDGTIRRVFGGVNPQGVRVACFKVPSLEELDHDYLWRIHQQAPKKGEIVIFNRSHYEDIVTVNVDKLAPPEVWSRRHKHINEFERMLADENAIIFKFYLHISPEEQKKRLEERLEDSTKQWKFSVGDLPKRKLWAQYTKAYESAISKTSTPWAPWYIIPANRKWYRNLLIAEILVERFELLKMKYPPCKDNLDDVVIE
jgi:PPK2 family polyphosphate:nucleotide phosphotransferase